MDGTMGLDLGDVSSESSRLTSIGNSLALPVNSIEGVVVAGGVDSLPVSAVPSGVSVSSSLVYPELDLREVISQNSLSEVSGSGDMLLDHREMFQLYLPVVSFPFIGGDGVAKGLRMRPTDHAHLGYPEVLPSYWTLGGLKGVPVETNQ